MNIFCAIFFLFTNIQCKIHVTWFIFLKRLHIFISCTEYCMIPAFVIRQNLLHLPPLAYSPLASFPFWPISPAKPSINVKSPLIPQPWNAVGRTTHNNNHPGIYPRLAFPCTSPTIFLLCAAVVILHRHGRVFVAAHGGYSGRGVRYKLWFAEQQVWSSASRESKARQQTQFMLPSALENTSIGLQL